jgi:geranylgeranyl diphosphate synthase type II
MTNHDGGENKTTTMLREYVRLVEDKLEILMPPAGEPPASLHEAMRYSVLGGGKRFRAMLCLSAHRLFGDPFPDAALQAACSVEMLHAYTLIHDDLPAIDDDDMRRGKASCHARYGEAVAILAGDALQALSFEALSSCRGPEPSACLEAVMILSRAAGSRMLVGGQVADIEAEGLDPDEEKVRFIHSRKTAELVSASMSLGSVLASADPGQLAEIGRIGRKVGLAFQIIDDLLDIGGSEKIVGKGLRTDSKRGKITWPACFGADASLKTAERLIDESTAGIRSLGDAEALEYLFRLVIERVS